MSSEAERKPDRERRDKTEHCAPIQPEKRQGLPAQRRVSGFLGLHLTALGRKISGSMVYKGYAIKARANEKSGQNGSAT